jgi:hypothetical protein
MTYSVIGCGPSGEHWDGHGLSIGVNDCFKFGKRTPILLIANHFSKFPTERIETIKQHNPTKFYTDNNSWRHIFPNFIQVHLRSWDGILRKDADRLQHANSSPFIAMSLAYNLGASKIVLYGVEFNDHPHFRNGMERMEVRQYKQFIERLREKGIKVVLGAPGSLLEEFLTVEKPPEQRWHMIDQCGEGRKWIATPNPNYKS